MEDSYKYTYSYSPSNNAFYPLALKAVYEEAGVYPEDLKLVHNYTFDEFLVPPVGFHREAGEDGYPIWVADPTPPPYSPPVERLTVDEAKELKKQLISFSSNKISILLDRIELGQDREYELKLWKDYRMLVDDVDASKAPAVTFPAQPPEFSEIEELIYANT